MAGIRFIVLTVWALAGLYFGIGGWLACRVLQNAESESASGDSGVIYEGIPFKDKDAMQDFVNQKEYAQWWPPIFAAPHEIWPLITSIAWGLVGGTVPLFRQMSADGKPLTFLAVFSGPWFGALTGSMLFWLLFLIPQTLVVSQNQIRAEALAGLSFFGGVFSDTTYRWVEKRYKEILFREKAIAASGYDK